MSLLQYAKVIKFFRKCKNFRKKSTGAFSKKCHCHFSSNLLFFCNHYLFPSLILPEYGQKSC